jgi:serine/threonine-protein kinase
VVHRDLKPSNLFLAKRGRRDDVVVLLDFGVAKHLHLQSMTATGQIWGTLQYMAPEQLTDSKRVDARSDIYAFGAVLYECLTGKPVFQSQCAVALGHEVVNRSAPDTRALRRDTPDALATIVARCLSKAPGDRFPNAASLYGALSALPSLGSAAQMK